MSIDTHNANKHLLSDQNNNRFEITLLHMPVRIMPACNGIAVLKEYANK